MLMCADSDVSTLVAVMLPHGVLTHVGRKSYPKKEPGKRFPDCFP